MGNILVFHFFRVSIKFKFISGISRFSVETFLSQNTKNLRKGTLLCFRIFLLWKIFLDNRDKEKREREREREREGYHDFLSSIFCLTVPKFFAVNSSVLYKFRVSKKIEHNWGLSRFLLNFFSHRTKCFRRGTLLCFRIILVSELFWIIVVSRLCRNCFCLTVPKLFAGETFSAALVSGIEKL